METIIMDLIYEAHPKYDCLEDLLWEFVDLMNEDSIQDLFEAIPFDKILDYLDSKNVYYKGFPILEVANLYILILTQEIIKEQFPKLYSEVK